MDDWRARGHAGLSPSATRGSGARGERGAGETQEGHESGGVGAQGHAPRHRVLRGVQESESKAVRSNSAKERLRPGAGREGDPVAPGKIFPRNKSEDEKRGRGGDKRVGWEDEGDAGWGDRRGHAAEEPPNAQSPGHSARKGRREAGTRHADGAPGVEEPLAHGRSEAASKPSSSRGRRDGLPSAPQICSGAERPSDCGVEATAAPGWHDASAAPAHAAAEVAAVGDGDPVPLVQGGKKKKPQGAAKGKGKGKGTERGAGNGGGDPGGGGERRGGTLEKSPSDGGAEESKAPGRSCTGDIGVPLSGPATVSFPILSHAKEKGERPWHATPAPGLRGSTSNEGAGGGAQGVSPRHTQGREGGPGALAQGGPGDGHEVSEKQLPGRDRDSRTQSQGGMGRSRLSLSCDIPPNSPLGAPLSPLGGLGGAHTSPDPIRGEGSSPFRSVSATAAACAVGGMSPLVRLRQMNESPGSSSRLMQMGLGMSSSTATLILRARNAEILWANELAKAALGMVWDDHAQRRCLFQLDEQEDVTAQWRAAVENLVHKRTRKETVRLGLLGGSVGAAAPGEEGVLLKLYLLVSGSGHLRTETELLGVIVPQGSTASAVTSPAMAAHHMRTVSVGESHLPDAHGAGEDSPDSLAAAHRYTRSVSADKYAREAHTPRTPGGGKGQEWVVSPRMRSNASWGKGREGSTGARDPGAKYAAWLETPGAHSAVTSESHVALGVSPRNRGLGALISPSPSPGRHSGSGGFWKLFKERRGREATELEVYQRSGSLQPRGASQGAHPLWGTGSMRKKPGRSRAQAASMDWSQREKELLGGAAEALKRKAKGKKAKAQSAEQSGEGGKKKVPGVPLKAASGRVKKEEQAGVHKAVASDEAPAPTPKSNLFHGGLFRGSAKESLFNRAVSSSRLPFPGEKQS